MLIHGVLAGAASADRQMEALGRGVVAIPEAGGKVFVGWRLLGTDPDDIAFNVYRSTGGAAPVKLNPEPLRNATNFVDNDAPSKEALAYFVRPVHDGREGRPARTIPPAGQRARRGLTSPSPSRPSPAIRPTTPRSATSTATASTRSS